MYRRTRHDSFCHLNSYYNNNNRNYDINGIYGSSKYKKHYKQIKM